MKASLLLERRINLDEGAFAELVLWAVLRPVPGSAHGYKYRLAYVVNGVCVLRYDNESGKGDHKHVGGVAMVYAFADPETLLADFWKDIQRWNDENRKDRRP